MNKGVDGELDKLGETDLQESYGIIRQRIEHVHELVNQRVLWQILTQAFFFGAYTSLLNAPKEAKNALLEDVHLLLVWLIPIAALTAGLFAYIGIISSLKIITYLRDSFEREYDTKKTRGASGKFDRNIEGPPHLQKLAVLSPVVVPMVLSLTWLIVLGSLLISHLS